MLADLTERAQLRLTWLRVAATLSSTLGLPVLAQSSPTPAVAATAQSASSITGTVVDSSGAAIADARLVLSYDDASAQRETSSSADGTFTFAGVPAGSYHIAITATGFAAQTYSAKLADGEAAMVPQITLSVASANTQVQVVVSRVELAEDEIKVQEKQRV